MPYGGVTPGREWSNSVRGLEYCTQVSFSVTGVREPRTSQWCENPVPCSGRRVTNFWLRSHPTCAGKLGSSAKCLWGLGGSASPDRLPSWTHYAGIPGHICALATQPSGNQVRTWHNYISTIWGSGWPWVPLWLHSHLCLVPRGTTLRTVSLGRRPPGSSPWGCPRMSPQHPVLTNAEDLASQPQPTWGPDWERVLAVARGRGAGMLGHGCHEGGNQRSVIWISLTLNRSPATSKPQVMG
jgi:hypothetical protein